MSAIAASSLGSGLKPMCPIGSTAWSMKPQMKIVTPPASAARRIRFIPSPSSRTLSFARCFRDPLDVREALLEVRADDRVHIHDEAHRLAGEGVLAVKAPRDARARGIGR